MKILKTALLIVGLAVVAVLAFAASKPDRYHIERSAAIAATPDVVFEQLNDFHRWEAWSPWEKLDPAMKRTFTGPASGKDASYAWAGNDKVGEGRMTIVESEPGARVGIQLEFLEPWPETCHAEFSLAPEGGSTRVKWTMDGSRNYVSKVFCVFMDMDKMIGTDFEKGLGQLKTVAESAAPTAVAEEPASPVVGGR